LTEVFKKVAIFMRHGVYISTLLSIFTLNMNCASGFNDRAVADLSRPT